MGRYEDMCKFVHKLVRMKSKDGKDLDVDERNLLSVAYKNVVGSKRASWRTLAGGFDDADAELLSKYKKLVEDELETICNEVLDLLKEHLCKNVAGNGDETEVFYLKMCGDYYRYLSEFRTESEKYKKNAEEYYKKAMDVAEANLNETHPTRLGWRSTSACATTRSSRSQPRRVSWPRSPSTRPSRSWTRSTTPATRTRRSSCSC